MPSVFRPVISNPSLFSEIVRTTTDVDPVLAFYGCAAAALAVLWAVGCLTFGRRVG